MIEGTFQELLNRLERDHGDDIAIRRAPADQEKAVTYRGLCEDVRSRMSALRDSYASQGSNPEVPTHIVTDRDPYLWIVDMFASVLCGYQTILQDVNVSEERLSEMVREPGERYPGHLLFFTSGTTASGKAVVLSQRTILRCTWNGQQMLPCRHEDRLLCLLPLSHIFGFVCAFLWPLSQGAEIDLGTGMRGLMTDARAYDPTIISVVPALLSFLLKANALNPALRTILVGAGPLDRESSLKVMERGIHLYFGYGITETSSGLAISDGGNDPYAMRLCPDTQMKLSKGGEILVKTPCMMECYYHDPEATAEKLSVDGWLSTGDLGEFDAEGRIHILGRLNDVLVMSNGEKIYCPEAEADLASRLGCECALTLENEALTLICGIPDDITEESGSQVERWKDTVRTGLAGYNAAKPKSRQIDRIRFREGTFPRTATGKLQRWKL